MHERKWYELGKAGLAIGALVLLTLYIIEFVIWKDGRELIIQSLLVAGWGIYVIPRRRQIAEAPLQKSKLQELGFLLWTFGDTCRVGFFLFCLCIVLRGGKNFGLSHAINEAILYALIMTPVFWASKFLVTYGWGLEHSSRS